MCTYGTAHGRAAPSAACCTARGLLTHTHTPGYNVQLANIGDTFLDFPKTVIHARTRIQIKSVILVSVVG